MGNLGRRAWLQLAAAAVLAPSRPSLASVGPRRPPKTLDDLLDEGERMLSPEALALVLRTPEPDLLPFANGVFHALTLGLDQRSRRARFEILRAAGVSSWDDQKVFFVTALVRRRRGQPLNLAEQLAPLRAAEEGRRAERETWNREHAKPGERIIIRGDRIDFLDIVYFARNTARPAVGQDELLATLPKFLQGNPDMELVQVVGHAERGERDADALSEARARWVVDRLVQGGVPASRLTPHGLGAACPDVDSDHAKRPGRDRRVEFVILKRPFLASSG